MLAVCASAWATTVYKWVDDNGVVHYSDQPNAKAQKLTIADAQTYGARDAAVAAPPVPATAPTRAAVPAVCVVDSPAAGQVFQDTFSITGHVTLAQTGADSRVMLRMDGKDISALLGPNGSFALSQMDRGDHTLTLQVTDAQGDVTCQANAVTFTIRQRSVIPPSVPTAPTAPGVARPTGR